MLDTFVASAGQYIHTNPWLALGAVFVGGILTASNPCVLAMIPLMMSFVAGRRGGKTECLGHSASPSCSSSAWPSLSQSLA
jgi:cytochrome c biogenesis protein CcdA